MKQGRKEPACASPIDLRVLVLLLVEWQSVEGLSRGVMGND